jgi:DNA-3-methyladenine glycosylase II
MTSALDPFHHDACCVRERINLLLGLSAAKVKTLKSVAREIIEKRLDLDALGERDADEAHNLLTALHGVGPWTADVYLLFCLGHGDAWPASDLALQEAVRMGLELSVGPTVKKMGPLAENWRPLRGAAAHLAARKREVAPIPAIQS